MANVYVYSGAAGAGTGADWANAYTTLAAACTAKAAGDTFFIAHDHAETQASTMTITSKGTEATPCRFYCVNRAGSVPPVSADLRTTATISTTGASNISLAGTVAECYGIIFTAGDSTNSASIFVGSTLNRTYKLNACALRLNGNHVAGRLQIASGAAGNFVSMENTTVQFANTSQLMLSNGRVIWRYTPSAVTGATIPTILLSYAGGGWYLEGVDLSAVGSGKIIADNIGTPNASAVIKDCKLGASVTVAQNPVAVGSAETVIIRCDSGDSNYRTEKYAFGGTQTTETTIVRSGGASDGTTPISWKIVTTANSEWEYPFECLPISIWNETVGSSVTVTVEGIWGGGAVPNNNEIWIDVEYLGTSGFPLASKATSTKADGLAAGSAITAGSGTWGGSTTKFAMSATFTPQEIGPITIYVNAAKVSSTFYVDPKVTVS